MSHTDRQRVLFSSKSDEWPTDPAFYRSLDAEFGFTLDPCATADSAKCSRFYTADDDGLAQNWGRERVFMNPPYGRAIGRWMRKAYESSLGGALVVCLVPSRTDTAWWHDWVSDKAEVRFVRGRLRFGDGKWPAPFPSAVVVYRPSQSAAA